VLLAVAFAAVACSSGDEGVAIEPAFTEETPLSPTSELDETTTSVTASPTTLPPSDDTSEIDTGPQPTVHSCEGNPPDESDVQVALSLLPTADDFEGQNWTPLPPQPRRFACSETVDDFAACLGVPTFPASLTADVEAPTYAVGNFAETVVTANVQVVPSAELASNFVLGHLSPEGIACYRNALLDGASSTTDSIEVGIGDPRSSVESTIAVLQLTFITASATTGDIVGNSEIVLLARGRFIVTFQVVSVLGEFDEDLIERLTVEFDRRLADAAKLDE
jgi:hypothetical protein